MRASGLLSILIPVIVTACVIHGLIMANLRRGGGMGGGGAWSMTYHYSYGWPAIALHQSVSEGIDQTGKWSIWQVDRHWSAMGIAVNSAVGLVVIASTAFAVRRIVCGAGRYFQFSIHSLLVATAIAGTLLTYWQNEVWILHRLSPFLILHGGLRDAPWYVSVATMFGLGCFIYLVGWMSVRCAAIVWRYRKPSGISASS